MAPALCGFEVKKNKQACILSFFFCTLQNEFIGKLLYLETNRRLLALRPQFPTESPDVIC